MKIKLSNGEAIIKDVYSRRIAKEVNKLLFKDANVQGEVKDSKLSPSVKGLKMESVDAANDYVLLNMVEKLTINGKDVPISAEALDDLSSADFNLIKAEIDIMAGAGEEKKE